MEIIPDKWVVIGITKKGQTVYKIFGSCAGGYLDGDSWKLNSGIESLTEDDNNYYFKGYSGSVYKCNKNHYGVATSYSQSVLENFQRVALEGNMKITIFEENNRKQQIDNHGKEEN
jgi:hypothetical protein